MDGNIHIAALVSKRGSTPLSRRKTLRGVLEVKCPYRFKDKRKYLVWPAGEGGVQVYDRMCTLLGSTDGYKVPIEPKYQRQLQWAMGTAGVKAAYFCAYVPCGQGCGAPKEWWQSARKRTDDQCVVLTKTWSTLHGCGVWDVMTKKGFMQVTRVPFMEGVYAEMYAEAHRFWHRLYAPVAAMYEVGRVHRGNVDAAVRAVLDAAPTTRGTTQNAEGDRERGSRAGVVGSWENTAAVVSSSWGPGWEEVEGDE